MRKRMMTSAALLGAGMLLYPGALHVVRAEHDDDEKTLFVWAGDQARV
jgi:hypothetical protein